MIPEIGGAVEFAVLAVADPFGMPPIGVVCVVFLLIASRFGCAASGITAGEGFVATRGEMNAAPRLREAGAAEDGTAPDIVDSGA